MRCKCLDPRGAFLRDAAHCSLERTRSSMRVVASCFWAYRLDWSCVVGLDVQDVSR
jgi:hypothetical protein